MDSFRDGEQNILNNTKKAIDNVKSNIFNYAVANTDSITNNLSGGMANSGPVRIKTMDVPNIPKLTPTDSNIFEKPITSNYGGLVDSESPDNRQSASSFVVVLAAIVALAVLAFVLAFNVFSMFKF